MKYYSIKTLMVTLPVDPTAPIIIILPSNAIPIGTEIRPASFPGGLFIHHLIPCDEEGNPIEISPTSAIFIDAWNELYKCFGERMQQDNLDLMDSVLKGVKLEMENEVGIKKGAE